MKRGRVSATALAAAWLLLAPPRAPAAPAPPPDDPRSAIDQATAQRRFALADSLALAWITRTTAKAPIDSAALAAAERSRGLVAFARRATRPDPAAEALVRAAAWLDHPTRDAAEAQRLRLLRATLHLATNQPDSALVRLGAVDAARLGSDSLRAEHRYLRGRALSGRYRWREAMQDLQGAAELMARSVGPRRPRVGEMRLDLAVAALNVADYDSAAAYLAHARDILEADAEGSSRALGELYRYQSTLARNLGDLSGSVELARRALQWAQRTEGDSSLATGRAHATLGLRFALVNDYHAADREFERAVACLRRSAGPEAFLTLNNTLMHAFSKLSIGDLAGARSLIDGVVAIARGDTTRHRAHLAFAHAIDSRLCDLRGDLAGARRHALASFDLYPPEQDSRGTARAETYLALFELADGAADSAEVVRLGRLYDMLADSTGLRRTNVHRSTEQARGRALARTGLWDEAWARALASDSLARDKTLADAMGLPASRGLELAHQLSTSLDVLLWRAADAPVGHVAIAWDRLVRWRGAVQEQTARLRTADDPDPQVRAAHAAWAAAQRRFARVVVAGGGEREDAEWRAAADAARAAAEEAERQYRRAAGAAASSARTDVGLQDVLASLAPDEALVSFAALDLGRDRRRVVALLATGRDRAPQVVDLGDAATIRAEVDAWRARLATPPGTERARAAAAERACRTAGQRVRTRVWDPVAARLAGAARIDVVGAGPLLDLPWSALPTSDGRYLAESAFALRVLGAERDRLRAPEPRALGQLLAMGDPVSPSGAMAAATRRSARSMVEDCGWLSGLRLEALPAARSEVALVAEQWDARGGRSLPLTGEAASEARFRAEAPASRVIHLATHGVMLDDSCGVRVVGVRGVGGVSPVAKPASARRRTAAPAAAAPPSPPEPFTPWLSQRVLLALGRGGVAAPARDSASADPDTDGWLTAEEVSVMDLSRVDWVVLSACHAGRSPEWPDEGALGMRRAFQWSGVRAVIAGLWAVEDQSTMEWMRALYAARATGAHAAASIQAAHRATLAARRAAKRSTHPFYWAAFVASGD